jgi:hypothetical protein
MIEDYPMNITLSTNTALTMDSTVLTIEWIKLSYTDLIVYGLFTLLAFIGFAVWAMTFKKGG